MRKCKKYFDYVMSIEQDDWREYANQAKGHATTLISYLMEKVRGFSVLDFAVFKIFMLSLGLWIGAMFSRFFGKIKTFLFISVAASWLYLIWRIFIREEQD